MTLQEALDKIMTEVNTLAKQAEADANYCRGAADALKRLVQELNGQQAEQQPEPATPAEV